MIRSRRLVLVASVIASASVAALAQTSFDFMPDGGKATLERLVETGSVRIKEIAGRRATEEEWRELLVGYDRSLDAEALDTLASYLAVNMPAPAETVAQLPPDGKQLAIDNCQFCHSFFSGYLAHERDAEGWRAIFKSPFHMELPMSDVERETFARYSAINMPIRYEDVPEELRF